MLKELYKIDEDLLKCNSESKKSQCINIEGALDKLPTGRRKATFWNAWKRRFFKAQDGYLHCYQVFSLLHTCNIMNNMALITKTLN